ncbi:hypothetical protein PVAND_017151 [Polypedilum vanderplanki]|uniref:CHK kinase-like domain-containing protein n=1 Tax=Polypedilum vanderplanki TaxID=319348 RepID=A0A9J6BHE7_POLVA|nr:hypothetical protein PVAND_017151 [Polypedilum vanderplanki]
MIDVTEKDIEIILEKSLIKYNGQKSWKIQSFTKNETLGFLGDHLILIVYNDDKEIADFFLKAIPRHIKKRTELINECGFFTREVTFYEHFLPILDKLSSISFAPKFFYAKNEHFIVLENLKDFKMFLNQTRVLDYAHFKALMKTLAIFHASSLIYEKKFGQLSEKELQMLKEVSHPDEKKSLRTIGVESSIEVMIKLIQLIPKYKKSNRLQEILRKIPNVMRSIFNYVKPSKKFQNVISHGDLWTNNVMFKYDKDNKIEECKIIDFQFVRYSPPAVDITTVLYSSTTKKFRNMYYEEMLEIYYNTMKNELNKNGIDHSNVFPYEELIQSMKMYQKGGLIEALLFCHLTLLPSDLASNILNSSDEYEKFIKQSRVEKCMSAFKIQYYRDHLTEILCELIDNFILYENHIKITGVIEFENSYKYLEKNE